MSGARSLAERREGLTQLMVAERARLYSKRERELADVCLCLVQVFRWELGEAGVEMGCFLSPARISYVLSP